MTSHHVIISYTVALTQFRDHVSTCPSICRSQVLVCQVWVEVEQTQLCTRTERLLSGGSVGSMAARLNVSVQGVRPQSKVQRSRSCRSRRCKSCMWCSQHFNTRGSSLMTHMTHTLIGYVNFVFSLLDSTYWLFIIWPSQSNVLRC